MSQSLLEADLARRISRCSSLQSALNGAPNPCSGIVNWQTEQFVQIGHGRDEALARHQLPEPWAGNLGTARILFISSNPSFSVDDVFPDRSWSDRDLVEYFTRRFVQRGERSFGATDGPTKDDQDRSIIVAEDGRVGLSKRVRTWQVLRQRAADILGQAVEETRASEHYALTEVVRCKSRNEAGVADALATCVEMWLADTLSLSPARLLVVSGAPAGIAVKRAVRQMSPGGQLPPSWGSWKSKPGQEEGRGAWPSSRSQLDEWRSSDRWTLADQSAHTSDIELLVGKGRRPYTVVWLPHPVKSVPQRLSDAALIDAPLIDRWRSAARAA